MNTELTQASLELNLLLWIFIFPVKHKHVERSSETDQMNTHMIFWNVLDFLLHFLDHVLLFPLFISDLSSDLEVNRTRVNRRRCAAAVLSSWLCCRTFCSRAKSKPFTKWVCSISPPKNFDSWISWRLFSAADLSLFNKRKTTTPCMFKSTQTTKHTAAVDCASLIFLWSK